MDPGTRVKPSFSWRKRIPVSDSHAYCINRKMLDQKIQSFPLILLGRPMSLDILRSKFFVVLVVHTKISSLEDVL